VPVGHDDRGHATLQRVVVAPQIGEEPPHLAPRVPAEEIGQLANPLRFRVAPVGPARGVGGRRRHREQLPRDVDSRRF
jgi:hypothetical protein